MKNIALGILAHVDAGKTTLSEGLLYSSGATTRLGRVDKRDAFLDTHSLERERGITIFSEQGIFTYNNSKYYPELAKTMTNPNTVYQWRRVYCRENKSNVCPTLTANMGTGGHNVPLIIDNYGFRKLTPEECVGFQGFPEEFEFPADICNASKYKQAGNSVSVPVIKRIAEEMVKALAD